MASSILSFLAAAAVALAAFPTGVAGQTAKAGVWLDVPYIKQTEDGCGSAAIAMLMDYWSAHNAAIPAGKSDAALIQAQLYSRKAHGIFASDMERYFRESGFNSFALSGSFDDLRHHLEQGRPLIVSLQPGKEKSPYHYVVVTGIDLQREAVFINDPARGKLLRVERTEFEKQWSATHRWMLLAVPSSGGAARAE